MLRSMYSGVSGLDSHQQMMDVIGNNIANVNTVGFKRSRVTFQEMLTQTMQGASASQDNRAGTNAKQVGLGTSVGSIDNDMTSGNLESTGKESDVAIQGDGFFVLRDGATQTYTRAGNFGFDEAGNLYSLSTGMLAQGWLADADGDFDDFTTNTMQDITLQKEINAQATSLMEFGKNLDASIMNEISVLSQSLDLSAGTEEDSLNFTIEPSETGDFNTWDFTLTAEDSSTVINSDGSTFEGSITIDKYGMIASIEDSSGNNISNSSINVNLLGSGTSTSFSVADIGDSLDSIFSAGTESIELSYETNAERNIAVDVFDSQGEKHNVNFNIVKAANNIWEIDPDSVEVSGADSATIDFNGGDTHQIQFDENGNLESGESVELTFTPNGPEVAQTVELDFSNVTQFANTMTATAGNVNGNADGSLESFSFTESGNIVGSYDNGLSQTLAKIALANFSNPAGLTRKEGVFEVSANSGDPDIGAAAVGGRGSLAPSNLEMSNANLSKEFTKMITAQRGFQANSKVITTSDEMLQELTNLKR